MENTEPSLVIQGWVGDKLCLVTVDTGAYVTVAWPDIAAGCAEPTFQAADCIREALSVLKEVS
jgi:hypothetical protein